MKTEFFIKNRKKLFNYLEDNSIVLLFSGEAPQRSADQAYKYTPQRNFYYMTGLEREKFILMLSKYNEKVEEVLFIEKPNPDLEKWIGKRMKKDEAKEISGVEKVFYTEEFENILNGKLLINSYENLYLDLERREWDSLNTKALDFAGKCKTRYPYLRIRNIYNTICNFRMIKSDEEIERMKKAIELTKKGIEALMKNSKPGMIEYQLEAYFDFETANLGCQEKAFKTIAAGGENGTVLHYEYNNCKLKDGDLILFDLGCEYDKYCADISRTFPVNGKFSERQREIYDIVLKAELETIKAAKPGLTVIELNEVTKKVLAEECKKIGLIKEDTELSKYYYHKVSHYLGLDTHDVGDYQRKLEPGMVITVEPGLYIEEEKIGIRIEDDVLITEDGCINLSKDIIKTVEEIEEFMKNKI